MVKVIFNLSTSLFFKLSKFCLVFRVMGVVMEMDVDVDVDVCVVEVVLFSILVL